MRITKTLTVSLPPAMLQELEFVKRTEQRTSSELIREALRQYFYSHSPVYAPTQAELRAIKQGRADIKKGDFVTLEQLHHELEAKNRKKSTKIPGQIPRQRSVIYAGRVRSNGR